MGCYDSVKFKCPDCGKELVVQSKSGECRLKTYGAKCVPIAVAGSLHKQEVTCECCQAPLVIEAMPSHVALTLSLCDGDDS